MIGLRPFFFLAALSALGAAPLAAELHTVIIGGLGGEARYDQRFAEEVGKLSAAAREGAADESQVLVFEGDEARRETLVAAFVDLQNRLRAEDSLAVYLVGHGSSDGRSYKFNIPGPDLSAERLASLLDKIPAERQLIVVATSSSGAAMPILERASRLVITATKNGREKNAAWFSKYWAAAFEDPEADTNKDERITAQEAFTYADEKVQDFFKTARNLATEHARIEGEAPETFTLARLGESAALLSDPALSPLLRERETLERKIDQLKLRKEAMDEAAYFGELQTLLLDLARLDARLDAAKEETAKEETAKEEERQ